MEWIVRDVESAHLVVTYLYALFIAVFIEFAAHRQAGCGGRSGDQLDDRETARQWAAAPVLCDVAEEAMLYLVPFRRAGRVVTNRDRQAGSPLGSSHHLRPLLAQIPILYAPVRH
jgi:hypothetical protein